MMTARGSVGAQAAASRARQGLGPVVTDAVALSRVAALLDVRPEVENSASVAHEGADGAEFSASGPAATGTAGLNNQAENGGAVEVDPDAELSRRAS